jgi:hypothetical protein
VPRLPSSSESDLRDNRPPVGPPEKSLEVYATSGTGHASLLLGAANSREIASWCRYCRLRRNQVKLRWISAAERVHNQGPQPKLQQFSVGFLSGISARPAAADCEGRPHAYSSLRSRNTSLQGKPRSGALANYCIREHACGFNPILRTRWLGCAR